MKTTAKDSPVCLGCDFGSKFGIAVLKDRKIVHHETLDLATRCKQLRCSMPAALYCTLRQIINDHGVTAIGWEDSITSFKGGRNNPKHRGKDLSSAIVAHAKYGAIVELLADVLKLTAVAPPAVSTLKKFATGNGKATKVQMIGAANFEFKLGFHVSEQSDDEHEADACHVANYVYQHTKANRPPF